MEAKRKTLALLAAAMLGSWVPASSAAQSLPLPPSGQTPQTTPSPHPTHALLAQAIGLVESHRSISARIWQHVELFGKQLEGTGIYLEQRSEEGLQLRLELRFPLDGEPCLLLQVCNGRYLWKYEKFSATAKLGRIDTLRVLQAIDERGGLAGAGNLQPWPGWGGIARLLRALDRDFDFAAPQAAELPGGFPTLRIEGRWKPDRLAALCPECKGQGGQGRAGDPSALPPQLPHHVVLHLGRDDLFPYRIEFRRTRGSGPGATADGDLRIAVMELREVVFNVPIGREQFHYDPGTLEYTEQTDRFLESLGIAR